MRYSERRFSMGVTLALKPNANIFESFNQYYKAKEFQATLPTIQSPKEPIYSNRFFYYYFDKQKASLLFRGFF